MYDGGFEPIREERYAALKKLGIIDRVKQMADAWQSWAERAHVLPLMHRERGEKSTAPPAND